MVARRVRVVLEVGPKRLFARALEWPAWTRSGRSEAEALESLAAYAERYRKVVRDPAFPEDVEASTFDVVERLKGGATTDFGAPGERAAADEAEVDGAQLARVERILRACWRAFDRAVEDARGVELRKGPRGGGRDLERIVEHVRGAEASYLVQLGARPPNDADMTALRESVVAVLRARARDEPIENPSGTRKRWPPRYFVHRAAWHVLDHAWEIEDRAAPGDG